MQTRNLATELYLLSNRLVRTLKSRRLKSDLSGERLSALLTLSSSGIASIKQLAESEQVAHSTMSRMVTGLTTTGLARAYTHEADRRTSSIKLTAKGRRTAQKTLDEVVDPLSMAIDALSEQERNRLVEATQVLERLLASLD